MQRETEQESFGAGINDPLLVSSIGSSMDTSRLIADIALQCSIL
jgi:hypothetical protein